MSYQYHAMSNYFNRDNVGLPGFAAFFRSSSLEERNHAQQLMDFQVCFAWQPMTSGDLAGLMKCLTPMFNCPFSTGKLVMLGIYIKSVDSNVSNACCSWRFQSAIFFLLHCHLSLSS